MIKKLRILNGDDMYFLSYVTPILCTFVCKDKSDNWTTFLNTIVAVGFRERTYWVGENAKHHALIDTVRSRKKSPFATRPEGTGTFHFYQHSLQLVYFRNWDGELKCDDVTYTYNKGTSIRAIFLLWNLLLWGGTLMCSFEKSENVIFLCDVKPCLIRTCHHFHVRAKGTAVVRNGKTLLALQEGEEPEGKSQKIVYFLYCCPQRSPLLGFLLFNIFTLSLTRLLCGRKWKHLPKYNDALPLMWEEKNMKGKNKWAYILYAFLAYNSLLKWNV